MSVTQIVEELKTLADPENLPGMQRFGIAIDSALGVPIPKLRQLAKKHKKDHALALSLWETGLHEARILAAFIDDPRAVNEAQMDAWVQDFNSWDLCDQCCSNLFDKTPFAFDKAAEWSAREEEFVKRAGFALMACLAVHDKKASDDKFLALLPYIEREAGDERNFVKKAVNWALRQIGKRNLPLNRAAIAVARKILRQDSRSARWIAGDALRELEGDKVQERLKIKNRKVEKT